MNTCASHIHKDAYVKDCVYGDIDHHQLQEVNQCHTSTPAGDLTTCYTQHDENIYENVKQRQLKGTCNLHSTLSEQQDEYEVNKKDGFDGENGGSGDCEARGYDKDHQGYGNDFTSVNGEEFYDDIRPTQSRTTVARKYQDKATSNRNPEQTKEAYRDTHAYVEGANEYADKPEPGVRYQPLLSRDDNYDNASQDYASINPSHHGQARARQSGFSREEYTYISTKPRYHVPHN